MPTLDEQNFRDLIERPQANEGSLFGGKAGPTPSYTSMSSPANPYAIQVPQHSWDLGMHTKGGTPLEVNILLDTELRRAAAHAAVFSKGDYVQTAQNIAAIRDLYPTMDPHVTASLALSGYGPDDDLTKYMAANAMIKNAQPAWQKIGADADTQAIESARGNLVDRFAAIASSDPKNNAGNSPGNASSGGGGGGGGGNSVLGIDLPSTGVLGDITSGVGKVYQAVTGINPINPSEDTDLVKGASRAVFSGLESPLQAVTGGIRENLRGLAGGAVNEGAANMAFEPKINYADPSQAATAPNLGQGVEQVPGVPGITAGASVSPFQQSSAGIAIGDILSGKNVDLGTGFFPGGQVEKQQAANARSSLSVAGHAFTPGRFAANLITEPGTIPYTIMSGLVDAAYTTQADPTNPALTELSTVRQAHNILTATPIVADDATGLINGIRRSLLPKSAERWLTTSSAGKKLVTRLAVPANDPKSLSFLQINKAVGNNPALAAQLHQASTPGEVMDALRPALGVEVRDVPKLPYAVTKPLRDVAANSRFLGTLPNHYADTSDIPGSVTNLTDYLRNAKVSVADQNDLAEKLAVAPNAESARGVFLDAAKKVQDALVARGVPKEVAETNTKIYDSFDELRHYFIDAAGKDRSAFFNLDGQVQEIKDPAYYVDFMNRVIPLPNVRAIRHDTSFMNMHNGLMTAGGAVAGGAAGFAATGTAEGALTGAAIGGGLGNTNTRDFAQAAGDKVMHYWKPFQVLRPALAARVLADAQLRMAADGQTNMITHPLHAIATMLAQKGPEDRGLFGKVPSVLGNQGAATDILHTGFHEGMEQAARNNDPNVFADALSGWQNVYTTDGQLAGRRLAGYQVINRDQDLQGFARAWGDRLGKLSSDPIAKRVAAVGQDGDLAPLKQYLTTGAGQKLIKDMIGRPQDAGYILSDGAGGVSASNLSQYIDNIKYDLTNMTQSDPELLRAIAEKKATINGQETSLFNMTSGGKLSVNRTFADHLQARTNSGDAPDFMIGKIMEKNPQDKKSLDLAMNYLFDHILTQPVNKFAQSPVFIDNYYKRVGELAPMMSPQHQEMAALEAEKNGYHDIASQIRQTGTPFSSSRRVGSIADKIAGKGTIPAQLPDRVLTPAEVDTLAKAHAVNKTKTLLHDLNHRGQFFDMFRNILPFGEAWKQMLTKWAKITADNPSALRKFQMGLNGAKDSGFFYTDPQTGQETFNYPGSQWLTKETLGVPIPLSGSVQGLNMLGNGLPGAGPMIQLPAAYLIPDTPQMDGIRKMISPFGNQNQAPDNNPFFEGLNAMTPSWVEKAVKAMTGPQSDRQFHNSTLAVMAYLQSTGGYGNSAAEQSRLINDAKTDSKWFYAIRSLGSATGPSAPTGQELVQQKNGNLVMLGQITNEYRKDQAAGEQAGKSYDQIDQDFLQKYGPDIFKSVQPFTRALVEALPTTKKQVAWERRNSDLMSKYPNTYGYFKPSDPNGTFDETGYQRHLDNKQIEPLPASTYARFANDKLASHLYYQAKSMMPDKPTKEDRAWLNNIHDKLLQQYPGFGSDIGKTGRATPEEQLVELQQAIKDPKVAKTPAAKGLTYAMEARQQVIDAAKAQGLSTATNAVTGLAGWQSAKKNLADRQWLSGVYQRIEKMYPDATSALNIVFANDVRNII